MFMNKRFMYVILLLFSVKAFSQVDTFDIQEVVISSYRTPALYSESSRIVNIMSKEEIKSAPVQSFQELLEYATSADLRQRGAMGTQADISIRGGSFEQTLILLNGIRMNDPQTGHHNLNLPVDLESIERIEILDGAGARVYGANAFSGAINIITNSSENKAVNAAFTAGSYGYFSEFLSTNFSTGRVKNYIAASGKQCEGYIENTDFDMYNAFLHSTLNTSKYKLEFQLGYNNKAFGANSFYTPLYPNQYEQTKTTFSAFHIENTQPIHLSGNIYYRRHQDRFELFRNNPQSWYSGHNYHLTHTYGFDGNMNFSTAIGKTSIGAEFRSELIFSNKLGEPMNDTLDVFGEKDGFFTRSKTRDFVSIFVEHRVFLKNFIATAGLLGQWNNDFGTTIYPGVEASYFFANQFSIFATANKSLRLPTYTDLYYSDPSHIGNENLKPEEAISYEGGLKFQQNGIDAHLAVYQRYGENIIDWVKLTEQEKWQATNLTEINSTGFNVSLKMKPTQFFGENFIFNKVEISYMYQILDKNSQNYISKYALDYLKHKMSFAIQHKIFKNLTASWHLTWQDRDGSYTVFDTASNSYSHQAEYKPFLLTDIKIMWSKPKYEIFVETSNLFDTEYYDFGNIEMPGRWLKAGIKVRL